MSELTEMFGEPISSYTWQDAVEDGLFIEITGFANSLGYTIPTAITTGSYVRIIDFDQADDPTIDARLTRLLRFIRDELNKQDEDDFPFLFKYMGHDMMVSIEGRCVENQEPVLTILLVEER